MATALVFACFVILSVVIQNTEGKPLDRFVRHYEHVHYDEESLMREHGRVRRSGTQQPLKLSFNAFQKDFDIRLFPDHKYIHQNAQLRDSKGILSKTHMKSYLYSGHDLNRPDVKVIGSVAFGVFDGKITDGDEVYYVEPSNRYLNDSDSHSIIYRKSDVDMSGAFKDHPEATPCGATTRTQQRNLAALLPMEIRNTGKKLNKRQSPDPTLVTCRLNVIADYKFYQALTSSSESEIVRRAQAISLIRLFVGDGTENFENQDFNGDETPDGITFSIFNLTVETEPPPEDSPFANEFLGAAAYLDELSSEDWSEYCLSYRFTYRDFAQGVLGLAFVAATRSRGGICDNVDRNGETFNTGIVTLLNYNSRVSNVVAGLTFTHEAGHNFGSQHDPPNDERDCQPSDSDGGKYVMFDRANDGSLRNNDDFSQCSRDMMISQIRTKGQVPFNGDEACFTTADDKCGNNIMDEGEICDCGLDYDSATMLCNDDPCCNGTSCQLARGVECSPEEGECCNFNCTFVVDGSICREDNDCALSQSCNGSSAVCPPSEARDVNSSTIIPCSTESNLTRYCMDGECTGSVCIPLGLDDCECTDEVEQCHVCCTLPSGDCESTFTLAENNETARNILPNNTGQYQEIGFPCNDFNGYCNFFNECQLINTEGAILRLTDSILNSEALQTVVQFFNDYWWAPIVAAVVIIIGMFIIVLVCHFVLPRPKHMKKRAERRKSIRQSRRGRNRVNQGRYSGYPSDVTPMTDRGYY